MEVNIEYIVYFISIVFCAFFSYSRGFYAGVHDGMMKTMENLLKEGIIQDLEITKVDDDGTETEIHSKEF